MKKMLVLALVLAVAGLANAGLDLSTVNGLSYVVDKVNLNVTISSTVGVNGYLFNLQPDAGVLSAAVVPAAFTTLADPGAWYATQGGHWALASASTSGTAVTGVIFSIKYAQGATKIDFIASDEAGDTSGITMMNQFKDLAGYSMAIPEPMTMVLLGLGGLFLRKKK